jgi:1-acyl-sn-glycerol-3-phosphate acyltransferase
MTNILAAIRALLFAVWSIPLVSAQIIVLMFTRGPAAYKIPRLWHTGLCVIFGMQVRVVGSPMDPHKTPVMFISNHVSYLDILVMGTVLEASFVAKIDVRKWPLFGFLSLLQQTAFISRSPKDALREKNSLQSYLKRGQSIILFPEGTTDNGRDILPFKSSLFSLAFEHELTNGTLRIQPFTLRTLPSGHTDQAKIVARDHYPWPFDDETPMIVHLWRFASGRGCTLELVFHQPIDPKQYTDRKVLCDDVRNMVVRGLETGHSQPIPTLPIPPERTPS